MRNIRSFFLSLFVVLLFNSCNDEKFPIEKLGTVSYYDSFWPSPADTTSLTKTFCFDFNADAKAKGDKAYAEFAFVDMDGNIVPTNELRIKDENRGEILTQNRFKVTSTNPEVKLKFTYLPEAKSGKHQGILRLVQSSGLDRVGSTEITTGQQMDLFKWSINFEKNCNPLKLALIWLLGVLFAALLIWMILLRPIFYPKFGSIQKTFNIPGMAPLIIRFKGARKVVVAASHQRKQSGWNRFWTGKILYITHRAFVSPITFKPRKGHRVLASVQAGTYQVLPNPIPGIGAASIIDIKKNLKINVN